MDLMLAGSDDDRASRETIHSDGPQAMVREAVAPGYGKGFHALDGAAGGAGGC